MDTWLVFVPHKGLVQGGVDMSAHGGRRDGTDTDYDRDIILPTAPTHPIDHAEAPVLPRRPGNHNKYNVHQNITNVPVLCNNNSHHSDHCDLFPEVTGFRNHYISNFILAHVNINSFRHKYGAIHDISSQKHVDYLSVSETKLDRSFPCAQFAAQDFTIHGQDLMSSSGGLLAYVRADLWHRRLHHAEINEHGSESLCMEVTIGKVKTAIVCIYKHPSLNDDHFKLYMSRLADGLFKTHTDLAFPGDMNCCPTKSSAIKDLRETYGLTKLIKEPTCHKDKVSTLLDVILVTNRHRYLGILNSPCCVGDFHNIIGAATRRFAPVQKTPKHPIS